MRQVGVKLLLLALAAAAVWAAWPRTRAGEAAPSAPEAQPAPACMGVATCASSACHHGNEGKGRKGSEYSTWAGHDKHAQAYQVLYNDRSRAMVRNLYGDGEGVKPATEQPLCLKCHATGDGDLKGQGPRFAPADGVGCESCHGPAEKYLAVHYRDGFRDKSAKEKYDEYGLWPTKNLAFRARLCAGCHVGDADTGKEVNHDLYAAGHPRLNFEFSAYLAQYPKHWNVDDDKARQRARDQDYEARVWALGQVACARASLALLEKRAVAAGKGAVPWPEFAEYDCFACHKNLRPDSPRQKAGFGDRLPGSLPWGTWYWSAALPFAKQTDPKFDANQWAELRKEMERPSPRPAEVSRLAGDLLKQADGWRAKVAQAGKPDAANVREFMARMLGDEKRAESLTWDEATQLYLALEALSRARFELEPGRAPSPEFAGGLRDLRKELVAAFQLPGAKGRVESPASFDPAKLKEPLRTLRANLGDK
jgi:hypothetical protein